MKPVIILVRPQMGENIGATARAMGNFGLSELRLVAPRDGWQLPSVPAALPPDAIEAVVSSSRTRAPGGNYQKALELAAHSSGIIEQATTYPTLAAALYDIQMAYAATARKRELNKRALTPRQMSEEFNSHLTTALVFGPENNGLNSDDITLTHAIVTIPVDASNASLNLGQSVGILSYEWFQRHGQAVTLPHELEPAARQNELHGLFAQLESYLDQAHYWRVADKKPVMWRNLQNLFVRNSLTSQEIKSLRGMFRNLWERQG